MRCTCRCSSCWQSAWRCWAVRGRRGGGGRWLIVAVCLLGLAIGSELAQSQLGRSASWLDLLADVAGAAAGLLGWWCFSKRRWLFLGGTFLFAVVIFLVLARGAWLRPMALRAQEISYPQLLPPAFTPWLVRVKDGTRVEWLGEEAGLRSHLASRRLARGGDSTGWGRGMEQGDCDGDRDRESGG